MFVPTAINVITAEDGSKAVVIGIDLIVPLDPDGIGDLVAELLAENTTQDQQEDTHE
jgi:hypothetical protein